MDLKRDNAEISVFRSRNLLYNFDMCHSSPNFGEIGEKFCCSSRKYDDFVIENIFFLTHLLTCQSIFVFVIPFFIDFCFLAAKKKDKACTIKRYSILIRM